MRVLGSWSPRWRWALRSYQRNRGTPFVASVCNAPLTNLYFCVDGTAAPCWLYFPEAPPLWGPDRSIRDIWNGPELSRLREAHRASRFPGRCGTCRHDIETGNRPLAA